MVYDGLEMVHFVFRADEVARAVEAETAYAGERTRDDAGRVMTDELVMDEEYGVLFRRLFLEARARVLQVAGSRARVTGFPRFDAADFDEERDFCFCLEEMDDAGARVCLSLKKLTHKRVKSVFTHEKAKEVFCLFHVLFCLLNRFSCINPEINKTIFSIFTPVF
ncbi:MAG: hypothetical protein LBK12_09045 [Odoribacteraceae bacterium]|jgi:hypothetical protein|nr:hypothetical protein [Odoribacteraceae bacterium]